MPEDIDKTKYMANQAERIEDATGPEASVGIQVNGSLGDRIVVSYEWQEENELESEE